jgi:hypothetical protein
VVQLDGRGNVQMTPVNAFSGDNGRAAILAGGNYYMAGSSGNSTAGGGTILSMLSDDQGIQMIAPGAGGDTTAVGAVVGTNGSTSGYQRGFEISLLGFSPDATAKDMNLRGLTLFNNVLYSSKGSGGGGINTVYQVGIGGSSPALPTLANAGTTPMSVLPGFPANLAKSGKDINGNVLPIYHPFGLWFASPTTLYVADEGNPDYTYSSTNGTYTNALPANNQQAGLEKWTFDGTKWNLAYTIQNGLNLGVPYAVPGGYPTSVNPATGTIWTPATGGLRNIAGKLNGDGSVTIYAVTSTVSGATDPGCDPNRLVVVTDTMAATSAQQGQAFLTLQTAPAFEVLRGVSFAPVSSTISTSGTLVALDTTYGTASATPASFTVSGTTVATGITVTPPSGYEVSQTSSTDGYAGSGTALTVSGSGTIAPTTIYVRLAATATVAGSPYTGNIVLSTAGANSVTVATASSTVAAKGLTITGLTGNDKVYDGTNTASFTGVAALNGVLAADASNVTLGGTPVAVFASLSAAHGVAIAASGYTISGTAAGNYSLTQPALTASITPKALTVTGAAVTSKVYDGTTAAVITGMLTGILGSDVVVLQGTGTFASPDGGTGITVISTSTLTGAQSGDYTLIQPTGLKGTITATGTIKPTVTISTPATGAKIITTATTVSVTGTATDKSGISSVQVSLDGGKTFIGATLGAVTTSATSVTVAWSATVTPTEGSNSATAQSANTHGNTSPLSAARTFVYHLASQLTVSRVVPSSQSATPDNVGNVTAAGAVLPAGANLNPKTALVQLGTSVTLTPTTKTGFMFKGWTFNPAVHYASGASNTATFAMVPSLTATMEWVANPYIAGAGGYAGLAHANAGTTASNANEGCLKATLTSTGSFTGSLIFDGETHAFTGGFDATGNPVFGAARTSSLTIDRTASAQPPLMLVLAFNAAAGNNQITGSIGELYREAVLPLSTLVADRAAFSATTHMPAGNTNNGYYTVIIPAGSSVVDKADFPQGNGIGTITVTTAGAVTLAATLADGTAVTASASLSAALTCPLFAQLYVANGGSFGGLITLNDDLALNHDLSGTSFLWFKPYVSGSVYPYGWPEGVTGSLNGAKYTVTAGVSMVPGPLGAASLNGNAALVFTESGLSDVSKGMNISAANVVTKLGTPPDASYTLTLTPKTGRFNGTFTTAGLTKPAFNGIVFNKTGSIYNGGYGFFISGATTTAAAQSGGVTLGKHP